MTLRARRQTTEPASWASFDELQQVYAQLRALIEAWDEVDTYVVEVEVPGVKKDDIEISLEGRRLTRYELVLPGAVDEDGVSASLDDGVLTVRVPKAASERQRRIKVT